MPLLTTEQFDLFKELYYKQYPEPIYLDAELYKLADLGWATKTADSRAFASWKAQANLIVRILNEVFETIP